MQVDYASVAVHRNLRLPPSLPADGSLFVVDVKAESPTWNAGLRTGMFIARVGDERVRNVDDFLAAVTRFGPTANVPLQVLGVGDPTIQTVSP
jgi:S1-C subfamily serine protease